MSTSTHPQEAASGKQVSGYFALPAGGKGPGLLVLSEIYGVNADVKSIADWYASQGFVVFAPEVFFWRKQAGLTFDYNAREDARAALAEVGGAQQVFEDIPRALANLRARPETAGRGVVLLGLGFGAIVGFRAAVERTIEIDAGIAYFPANLALDKADALDRPWLFHFPENDEVAGPELLVRARQILGARQNVELHEYAGTRHGFAIAGRDAFDVPSTERAAARDVDFLRRQRVLAQS